DDQQPCITAVDDDPSDRTTVELDDVELGSRKLGAVAGRLCLELESHELLHCGRRERQRAQCRRPRLAEQAKAEFGILLALGPRRNSPRGEATANVSDMT